MYVIDASVLVADVRPQEPSHSASKAFLALVAHGGNRATLPTIVLPEVAAAIARGTGRPDLADHLVRAIREVPHYQFEAVDLDLSHRASALAATHYIRGCDAIYVALARKMDAVLITLDQQQLKRVPADMIARTPAQELERLGT